MMDIASMTEDELAERLGGIRARKQARDIYYQSTSPTVKRLHEDIDVLLAILDKDEFMSWEAQKAHAGMGSVSRVEDAQ